MIALSNQFFFGIALILGLIIFPLFLRKSAKKNKLNLHIFESWIPLLTISSIFFSRLFSLAVLDWQDLLQTQWWQLLKFWDGNLNLIGAIFGFVITLWILCKKDKEHFGKWLDALAKPFLLVLALARLGNFLDAGVYYGRPTDHFPGLTIDNIFFPLSGLQHHPIALYESIFAITAFLSTFTKKVKTLITYPGTLGVFTLLIYSVWRFLNESLRFDATEILENITWDQALSIFMIIFILISISIHIIHAKFQTKPSQNRK